MADNEGFGQSLLKGSAVLGRIYATIGAVIAVIIALIIIIAGVLAVVDPHTQSTLAVVVNVPPPTCTPVDKKPNSLYHCVFSAAYTVNGKQYVEKFQGISGTVLTAGDKIPIRYVPSNPAKAVYGEPSRGEGMGMILGGLVLGGIAYWFANFVYRYKGVSSAYGMLETARLVL